METRRPSRLIEDFTPVASVVVIALNVQATNVKEPVMLAKSARLIFRSVRVARERQARVREKSAIEFPMA